MVRKLTDAIRASLVARRLTVVADRADLVVESRVTSAEFAIGSFGRPNLIRPGERRGGRGNPAPDFSEATLVVDIKKRDPEALLWRGVYHDTDSDAKKLADALAADASKILAAYPPRR